MSCSVDNCENHKKLERRKPGLSFHYFPTSKEMSIKWLDALGWKNRIVNGHHRICSEHFEEHFLDKSLGYKTRLKKDAVPTIFTKEPQNTESICDIENISEDIIIDFEAQEVPAVDVQMEARTNFEEAYRKQSLLVEGLYEEIETNEIEANNLRDELEVLQQKYRKLKKMLAHLRPLERLVTDNVISCNDEQNHEIYQFAVNLYNISPSAYDYVQTSLLKGLPDVVSFEE